MMDIIYKISLKVVAICIHPLLRAYVHTSQSGFIGGRSTFHNILTVQLGVEYAQSSQQDMVLKKLDFKKAFDSVDWSFIQKTMMKMGFGVKMANHCKSFGCRLHLCYHPERFFGVPHTYL